MRQIIQIVAQPAQETSNTISKSCLFALCDDSSVWRLDATKDGELPSWKLLVAIPDTEYELNYKRQE